MSSRQGFHSSSPSSGGAESINGTPETRLTPFSSVKSAKGKNNFLFNTSKLSPAQASVSMARGGLDLVDKDPFISNSIKVKSEPSVLSPTASAFQPFALRVSQGINHTPMVVNSPGPSTSIHTAPQPIEQIVNPRRADDMSSPTREGVAVTQSGTFSTDSSSITRALKVSGVDPIQFGTIQTCVQKACNHTRGSLNFVRFGDDILMRFSDIVDSIEAYNALKRTHREWSIDFITPATFAEKNNPKSPFISAHEGQIRLVANFPAGGSFDRAKLEGIILDLLSIDGTVYAYQKQLATEAGTLHLIAEYTDVNSAARAVERLNGATVRGINVSIAFHKPDVAAPPRHRGHPSTPTRVQLSPRELTESLGRMSVVSPGLMNRSTIPTPYASVLSPTGRSFIPTPYEISPVYSARPLSFNGHFSPLNTAIVDFNSPGHLFNSPYPLDDFGTSGPLHHGFVSQMASWDGFESPSRGSQRGSQVSRFGGRRQNAARGGSRSAYANSQVGQHNVVDIDRIRAGLDVRTTIMLRNIPNKIDQAQLKAIVDQTSRGLYDFMYLRIDFANNCNVGYAFINFEDPYHIINFVAARAGQRWNRYSSDKIAEVSYATIQGKDCLVQKFRNSSVMLEHPSFRPKIFFTGTHLRAGDEEDFPLPDNASKMRRSVENAEHVGLFAPRAGQHYRDEQRRRRSRYDRGTPLAALEEYDYEDFYALEQDF